MIGLHDKNEKCLEFYWLLLECSFMNDEWLDKHCDLILPFTWEVRLKEEWSLHLLGLCYMICKDNPLSNQIECLLSPRKKIK